MPGIVLPLGTMYADSARRDLGYPGAGMGGMNHCDENPTLGVSACTVLGLTYLGFEVDGRTF